MHIIYNAIIIESETFKKGPKTRGVELFYAHLGLCRRWSGAESAGLL